MEPDKWTPARGFLRGMTVAVGRMLIATAVITAIYYFAWPLDKVAIGVSWTMLILTLLVSSVLGVPVAMKVVKKLDEVSGLAMWSMLLPVFIIVVGGEYAAFCLAELLRGEPVLLMWTIAIGVMSWSLASCLKSALTE